MRTSEFKQSEPGGLYLPMHATLKGRVRWQVLDERGVPEIPRTPSGAPIGPVEGVEQDNLITDLGMDQIATNDIISTEVLSGSAMRRYMAVGTGSAAPDVLDVALDNEVQRAASSGSFSQGSAEYTLEEAEDVFRADVLVTRIVTMNTDRNLTEFGFSPAGSGSIGIRELLRDGGGNPITVSLLNGKSLRVDHRAIIDLPAPELGTPLTIAVDEYDAGNNLIQSIPYDVIFGPMAASAQRSIIFSRWNPATSLSNNCYFSPTGFTYNRAVGAPSATQSQGISMSLSAYSAGSHQRTKRGTYSTGQANGTIAALKFVDNWGSTSTGGVVVIFDDPATYTKKSTDTLRVGLVSTWARA